MSPKKPNFGKLVTSGVWFNLMDYAVETKKCCGCILVSKRCHQKTPRSKRKSLKNYYKNKKSNFD